MIEIRFTILTIKCSAPLGTSYILHKSGALNLTGEVRPVLFSSPRVFG